MSDFKEVEDFLRVLDSEFKSKINLYFIGGVVLLYQELKPATKDIDLIVRSRKDFSALKNALEKLKFESLKPDFSYSRLNLSEIFQKDNLRLDLFEREVCGKFFLSDNMVKRSRKILSFNNLNVFLVSNEDIFLFKSMTEREGDLSDCIALAKRGLNWDVVLSELLYQSRAKNKDVWITWVGERFDILEERGLNIPIMSDVNKLRDAFFRSLEGD